MHKKRGFTLIELIVVIAILAIIAAIAVPTAFGSIENARKAACNAQIDALISSWRLVHADKLLNASDDTYTMPGDLENALIRCNLTGKTVTSNGLAKYTVADACPSTGVSYTVEWDDTAKVITVSCDKHGENGSREPGGTSDKDKITGTDGKVYDNIFTLMLAAINSVKDNKYLIDSSSTKGDKVKAVLKLLDSDTAKAQQIITDANIGTWQLDNRSTDKQALYFTDVDINKIDVSKKPTVPVVKYDPSTGKYSVCTATPSVSTVNGEKYNVLVPSSGNPYYQPYGTNNTGLSYEEALAVLKKAQAEYPVTNK